MSKLFGIRLPYHETNLLLKRAKRESKRPTTVAKELLCKTLRRQRDLVPQPVAIPDVPPPQPPPPVQTTAIPMAATLSVQPEPPLPPPVVIPAISIFPAPIQKAVIRLANKAHLSNEKVLVELIGSMLAILTEDAALRMVTCDPSFTIEDLVKTVDRINKGELTPVVSAVEAEAEMNTSRKAPTVAAPSSPPSPPTSNRQF